VVACGIRAAKAPRVAAIDDCQGDRRGGSGILQDGSGFPVGKFDLKDPKGWFRRFLLDLDARIDSTLFSSGAGARELYERFSTFMDRFHVGRWKRWVFIEPASEAATLGLLGLIAMLALAIPAFRETSDEDWLKKS
jgi:penicillin-binding protein 1A